MTQASRMNHSPAHTPKLGATIHYLPSFRNGTVSIHAPAWGATSIRSPFSSCSLFQSTLPRGERLSTFQYSRIRPLFQSTLPRGERRNTLFIIYFRSLVSIHAPTLGATSAWSLRSYYEWFQSTLPRGERLRFAATFTFLLLFQSTLPRGERRHETIITFAEVNVSIHAPTWGATYPDN